MPLRYIPVSPKKPMISMTCVPWCMYPKFVFMTSNSVISQRQFQIGGDSTLVIRSCSRYHTTTHIP